jgi:hypothetical protein
MNLSRPLLCLFLTLLLSGCALFASERQRPAAVALATEGPPLALVGEYEGMRLEGFMDRNCMAGYGSIALRSLGAASPDLAVNLPSLPNASEDRPQRIGKVPPRSKKKPERKFPPALSLETYQQRGAQEAAQAAASDAPARNAAADASKASRAQTDLSAGLVLDAYQTEEPAPRSPRPVAPSARSAASAPSLPLGQDGAFVCRAKVDHPPTEKGRIRGVLHCTGERKMLVTLRNIGPDQGVGIGKENENGDLMILFYHAALDEAWRRFPAVKADILAARERQ